MNLLYRNIIKILMMNEDDGGAHIASNNRKRRASLMSNKVIDQGSPDKKSRGENITNNRIFRELSNDQNLLKNVASRLPFDQELNLRSLRDLFMNNQFLKSASNATAFKTKKYVNQGLHDLQVMVNSNQPITNEIVENAMSDLRIMNQEIIEIAEKQNKGAGAGIGGYGNEYIDSVNEINGVLNRILFNVIDGKDQNLKSNNAKTQSDITWRDSQKNVVDLSKLSRSKSLMKRAFGIESNSIKEIRDSLNKLEKLGIKSDNFDKFKREFKEGEINQSTIKNLRQELSDLCKHPMLTKSEFRDVKSALDSVQAIELGKVERHSLDTVKSKSGIISKLLRTESYIQKQNEKNAMRSSISAAIGEDGNRESNNRLSSFNSDKLGKMNSYIKTLNVISEEEISGPSQLDAVHTILGIDYKKIIIKTLIESNCDLKVFDDKISNFIDERCKLLSRGAQYEKDPKQMLFLRDSIMNHKHECKGEIKGLIQTFKETDRLMSSGFGR